MIIEITASLYRQFKEAHGASEKKLSENPILLESFTIGLKDSIYHLYINDDDKELFESFIGKDLSIKDTGRTKGFYQNFGTIKGGIYSKKDAINIILKHNNDIKDPKKNNLKGVDKVLNEKRYNFFKDMVQNEVELSVDKPTWKKIIEEVRTNIKEDTSIKKKKGK